MPLPLASLTLAGIQGARCHDALFQVGEKRVAERSQRQRVKIAAQVNHRSSMVLILRQLTQGMLQDCIALSQAIGPENHELGLEILRDESVAIQLDSAVDETRHAAEDQIAAERLAVIDRPGEAEPGPVVMAT